MPRALLALAILTVTAASAFAEGATSFVVPGRAGVPIIINGIDASYAVVESDYGLARGIRPRPVVYGGRPVEPLIVGRYFPSAGHLPGYGRLEIEPPTRPRSQPEFYRSWSSQSAPPAAIAPVPEIPPAVILAQPDIDGARPEFPDRNVRRYGN